MPGDLVHVASYDQAHKWLSGTVLKPVGNVMYDVRTEKGILTRNVTQCLPQNSKITLDTNPHSDNSSGNINHNNADIIRDSSENNSNLNEGEENIGSDVLLEPVNSDRDSNADRGGTEPELRRSTRIRKPRQVLDL